MRSKEANSISIGIMIKKIIHRVRLILLSKPLPLPIRGLLRKAYWKLNPCFREANVVDLVLVEITNKRDFRFVQIGANDGIHADHLAPFLSRNDFIGWMIEPNPLAYRQLEINRGDDSRFRIHKVGISDSPGILSLYFHDDDLGMASFDLSHVRKHLPPHQHPEIVSTTVPLVTFSEFVGQQSIHRLNLLLIDTEGYDGKILKSIDFSETEVDVIIFEQCHLDPKDRDETFEHLRSSGYILAYCKEDVVAIQRSLMLQLEAKTRSEINHFMI
ncbi:MAG: FkbM family methyltransferase [Opitutales bacterium]|nr:FkbM family methyltransferase [Opitutales bacterium]